MNLAPQVRESVDLIRWVPPSAAPEDSRRKSGRVLVDTKAQTTAKRDGERQEIVSGVLERS